MGAYLIGRGRRQGDAGGFGGGVGPGDGASFERGGMRPGRTRAFWLGIGVVCLMAAAVGVPRPARAATPTISFFGLGTPTATVVISGSGFDPNAPVEAFFDTADVASATAGPTGTISGLGLDIPVTAIPGAHWITVKEPGTGLSAQASYFVSSPWSQFRSSPGLTGLNPYENLIGSLNISALAKSWSATTGGPVRSSPAVGALGFSYVGSNDGKVYAFPPGCKTTCPPKWTATTGGAVSSSPVLGSGNAYVGSADGKLYALPTSCTKSPCLPAWTGITGGPITSSPTISGNILVGSGDGKVYAFKNPGCGAATCSPVWTLPTGGPVTGAPAIAFGKAYVGSGDGKVYALNPSTGAVAWQVATNGPIVSSVAVAQQPWFQPVVYAVSQPGTLYALNAYTGALLWTAAMGGTSESSPAVAYGDVYVGSDDHKLYAFSAIGCAKPTCAPLWTQTTGQAITASPAVGNGIVFDGSNDGTLYAYNARSGAQLWTAVVGGAIGSSPAVAGGMVYVGSDGNTLTAFKLANAPVPPPRPDPNSLQGRSTPIRHVVVIYQENHSFDDVLGALCVQDARCDGATTGTLPDGTTVPLSQEPDLVPEIAHTIVAQTTAVDGGKMDGFGLIDGCTSAKGYACYTQYQPSQIPNLAALARGFALSDRTFESDAVPSWGAHVDLAAAQMDGFLGDIPVNAPGLPRGPLTWGCDSNNTASWRSPTGSVLSIPSCIPNQDGSGPFAPSPAAWIPTIMDRLDGAGMSWRIYGGWGTWTVCPSFSDCVYGPQRNAAVTYNRVLTDASNGTLPNLSIVIPTGDTSQHNGWSMLKGDNWIGSVVGAIENGPDWRSTAIFITYDDCGCFYDHVPPPPGLGIRVPMVIVSPYARAGFTDSTVASYSSMLAYAEHVFGLSPLFTTDGAAYDFANSFDYTQAPLGPVSMERRTIPAWERKWLREHPPPPDAT
jgi:outer membrane protein assembly factor BamB/phospholipase C